MLPAGSSGATLVTLDGVPPQDEVTQFRVAPDGVRAAMIVRGTFGGRPGSQVQLVAITHSGPSASVGSPVIIGSAILEDWIVPKGVRPPSQARMIHEITMMITYGITGRPD